MTMQPENLGLWNDIWKTASKDSEEDSLPRLIFEVLSRVERSFPGKRILEAGSGSGSISLKLARAGANVSLLDLSVEAINFSKELFSNANETGEFITGSIFDMPVGEETYDIVWNAGVLEHFSKKEQKAALKEMLRICKPGGIVITLNPYTRAFLYRFGKWYAEKTNKWRWGTEIPFRTLKGLTGEDAPIVREYAVGFLEQFRFLYCVPGIGPFLFRVGEKMKIKLWQWNFIPGYLLVSIFQKR